MKSLVIIALALMAVSASAFTLRYELTKNYKSAQAEIFNDKEAPVKCDAKLEVKTSKGTTMTNHRKSMYLFPNDSSKLNVYIYDTRMEGTVVSSNVTMNCKWSTGGIWW